VPASDEDVALALQDVLGAVDVDAELLEESVEGPVRCSYR
jgi:hypothetical protein